MNIYKVFLFTFFIILSGCTKVGPDYVKPETPKMPSKWDSNTTKADASIKEWWKIFNDKTLNTLVARMYEENLDLRAAGLRILQARAALGLAEGFTYPQQQTLSGSLSGVRQNGTNFLSAGTNFNVGWEMDVWGKYARNIESSEALLYASVASYDDILVTLIAEVARNYINYQTFKQRIAYAQHNIEIQEKIANMTQVQFNTGNVSELDVEQAKTQLYSTKSAIPSLKLNMIKARNALAVLLGILPEDVDAILNTIQEQKKSDSYIPQVDLNENFTIQANLIARRPDIRVAEAQAKAQNARIGSAEAELYPHFSLFGSLGINSNNANDGWISANDAVGISAGPAFSWNIFQYDRIKNQIRIQDAKFQESLTNYNKKVLSAVNEVSDALSGYRLTKEQLELNKKTVQASKRAVEISMTQYENGMTGYERLLTAIEKLVRDEDIYAQIKGNIDLQIVLLYKALGGGWQIRQDRSFLHKEDVQQMSQRSDWGDYLKEELKNE